MVMTVESIGAGDGKRYALYLEGKTRIPAAGRYYLTPEGEPAQAPGRWLCKPETLRALGIDGPLVHGPDFVALIEGRHPETGRFVRPEGAGGGRSGGVDATFSAPKSVSVRWALADETERAAIEQAHSQAVAEAFDYMRQNAPLVRRRIDGIVVEEPAVDLIAPEYRHTVARGVDARDLPDPHLHSHVVITSVLRGDGQIAAVSSRPMFRVAREAGSFYRSALASNLVELGYEIEGQTGRDGRYFELAGVSRQLREAFSRRTREVQAHIERFRARYGRAPQRGELRVLKSENRPAKRLVDRGDLDRAWRQIAEAHPEHPEHPERPGHGERLGHGRSNHETGKPSGPVERVIEERLTEKSSTFTLSELRATVFEQTAGRLTPTAALELASQMTRDRAVIPLGAWVGIDLGCA
jgi:conjugative relaxase-like TrwC/TraI family protein